MPVGNKYMTKRETILQDHILKLAIRYLQVFLSTADFKILWSIKYQKHDHIMTDKFIYVKANDFFSFRLSQEECHSLPLAEDAITDRK